MIWPFKRKARPGPPPKTVDRRDGVAWRRGELAVCIVDGVNRLWHESLNEPAPAFNQICRVVAVCESTNCRGVLAQWLYLEGFPGIGFASTAFRKAVQDHNACEDEFRIAMRDLIKGPVA